LTPDSGVAVSGAIAFLDESKAQGRHRIISVGGFVAELDRLPEVERRWRDGKAKLGLDPDGAIKHSGDWPDREIRSRLVEVIGGLPVQAVIALLEDLRPESLLHERATRSELYVHRHAFDYVLQRLATNYFGAGGGPHFVAFDLRDDFRELSRLFAEREALPWSLRHGPIPSLRSLGVCGTLLATDAGACNEIADFVVSAFTRWAGGRCAAHVSGACADLSEHDRCARALAPIFPVKPSTFGRRRGYSIVTFTQQRTGRELLRTNVETWLRETLHPADRPQ
jgi:hypothetical protein